MVTEGQHAFCVCPHKGLPSAPETQPPITLELSSLATGRDEKWMPELFVLTVCGYSGRELTHHEAHSDHRSVQDLSTT